MGETATGGHEIAFIFNVDMSKRYANINSALQNVSALANIGHRVTLYTVRQNKSLEAQINDIKKACLFYNVQQNFKIKIVGVAPWPAKLKGLRLRLNAYLMARAIKKEKHSFVWSRHIFPAIACVNQNLPLVFEHHTMLTKGIKKGLDQIKMNPHFLKFLAISERHKDIIAKDLPKDKILALHSGADAAISSFIPKKEMIKPGNIVTYAGSFYKGRGVELMVQVAKLLPDFTFNCIGASEQDFEVYKKELESCGNLVFVKKVPRGKLIELLHASDCLVAPYTSDCETVDGVKTIDYASPMKIVEYLFVGKPIIATDIGAIPEILTHGQNGLLVPENDIDALSSSIERVFADKDLQKKLSINAKRSAKRFLWDERVKTIVYETLG